MDPKTRGPYPHCSRLPGLDLDRPPIDCTG
jgi:hypothetical protein